MSTAMTPARRRFPLWAPFAGAAAGLAALVPFHAAIGGWMGWNQAEASGQIGWAILTVPAGPFMLLLGVKLIALHIGVLMAVWAVTVLLANLFLNPTAHAGQGAMQGVLMGIPVSLAAFSLGFGVPEDMAAQIGLPQSAFPLMFGGLSLIACAVGGATVASIVATRSDRA